jgi:multicomponent Na+:H+ antiporter subunit D
MYLPILQVVIPLMAAPACLILQHIRLAWLLSLIACVAAFAISVILLQQVTVNGVIDHQLGGWGAPWGIEYRIDILNAYVLLLVSSIATIVLLAAHTSIRKELPEHRQLLFYIVFLLCVSGLLGIIATGDVFNVFVFLEISALSSYVLVAMGEKRIALWAAFQYLIMGSIGATFILIGIGLIYAMTGTLNMQDLAARLPEWSESRVVLTALIFLIAGIGLKLALFPVHMWLPNTYTYAPSIVTAFLAATATKVAVYLLIRIIFTVFGAEYSFSKLPLQEVLQVLGLAGVIVASILAIVQENVKRLFAYSSVAQIGYMVLGISFGNAAGLTATLLHVFNHALMKGALFLALAAVVYRIGSVHIKDLAGLGRRMPWTMAAIVIGGLSLIGVPLTVGFISKWYLVVATVQQGWWWATALVLIGSLLAIIYVWRLIEIAYFQTPQYSKRCEAPLSLLLPAWLMIATNVWFGIDTRLTVGIAERAAALLTGGGL